ncbi:MAG: AbiV family abortive infection protein [Paraglaciecola sp.]|uniref:AbiV family abortive infection protein n=1 Tax=Paraglaciecola sp. TaxID=1920173 RepID=UPI003297932E
MSLNLKQIDDYISALIENADCLVREANILLDAGGFARAHTLSHLAREELSKCIILYAAGRRIQCGIEVDWKSTMKRLRDHKSKIRQETVMNAVIASAAGSQLLSDIMLNNVQHLEKYKNDKKNNSIYVGLGENGEIVTPSREISEEKAKKTISLAEIALEQEKRVSSRFGNLTDVEPGSVNYTPKIIDGMSREDLEKNLKDMAQIFITVLERAYEDESNK